MFGFLRRPKPGNLAENVNRLSSATEAYRPLFDPPSRTELDRLIRGKDDLRSAPVVQRNLPPNSGVVTVKPLGALANRMIQHMVALSIASRAPNVRISRIELPEWGMKEDEIAEPPKPSLDLGGNVVDVERVAAELREGTQTNVVISGYVQNIRNLMAHDEYRRVFTSDIEVQGFGADVLLINVRMAEILSANYPPYVLIPISFYRQVVRDTGLRPVFFGQLTPCPYLDDLRAAFPEAEFIPGKGAIHDFEVIRRSKNVCVAVSTFSWVASWLSDATRIILPLSGLFNPVWGKVGGKNLDLIPRNDPRYLFYLLPMNDAVTQDHVREVHASLDGRWRSVTSAWVDDCLRRHGLIRRSKADHLAVFDEQYYFAANDELADAKRRGVIKSGREHFEAHGFDEKRSSCSVGRWYAVRYPDAALAVAEGHYYDLVDYYASHGRFVGQHPVPD